MAYPYAVTGTTATEEDVDLLTGQKRKPPAQLPTQDNTVQNVPLVPGNISTQSNTAAQTKAQGGFQSGTMDAVVAGTQNLLKDPSMGKDYAAEKGLQLEQQNRNMNQQLETLRQQTAPQAYTGQNLRDLTNVAMQNVQQRADTGRQIDIEQNTAQREAAIQALAEGRTTAAQERGAFDQDIENLIKSSEGQLGRETDINKLMSSQDWQGAQNELDRRQQLAVQNGDIAGQKEIAVLQNDLTLKRMVAEQNFTGAQAELDRRQQLAVQKGDIAGQKEIAVLQNDLTLKRMLSEQNFTGAQAELDRQLRIAIQDKDIAAQERLTTLKGEIDAKAQAAQQEFSRTERIATQSWQTGERLSSQDYDTVSKTLEQKYALALQANDIASAEKIADQRGKLDLLMQTNSMNQQEKMAYLESNLAEARATNDVVRQTTILEFTHGQELDTLARTQGYEVAMANLQNQFDVAMQAGDFTNAKVLLGLNQTFQAQEAAKDRLLDEARIKMEQEGLDFDKFQQTYNNLLEQDPTMAFNYLQKQIEPLGLSMKFVDAATKAKDVLQADMEAQEYQYGLTHPKMLDPATRELTDAGKDAFYKQFNAAISGENAATYDNLIKGLAAIEDLRGGATPGSANSAAYTEAYNTAQEWTPQLRYDDKGFWGADERYIDNVPAKNSIIKYGGNLYQVVSDKSMRKSGQNTEVFKVIDVNTGEITEVFVNGMDTFLNISLPYNK